MTGCALCGDTLQPFGEGTILGTRTVTYHRCDGCGSVLLPEPDWLDEAYSSAISALDVGLLERCLQLANVTTALLSAQRLGRGTFLDFAGGYGTLTRLMRDRGFDFRHVDPYCQNVFAPGLDGTTEQHHDLVTAFEVLEHLPDPVAELAPAAACSDFLLTTTQLLPSPAPPPGTWDYYAPQTGQHVTFYTAAGLDAVAQRLGLRLTSSGRRVHLFHRVPLRAATRALLRDERLAYAVGAVLSEARRRRGRTAADAAAAAARLRDPSDGLHDPSGGQPG
jgi:Methyltransferase domain